MIHSIEIILLLLATVITLETMARRIGIPSPFLLLPAGILLGYINAFPRLTLEPDLVLFIFLPLLVYAGTALGSWVDFRKYLRPITLMSVGCVLFTTAVVAATVRFLIPGFGWAPAFVLGAIVSPPDTVAAVSIARRLGIPKRLSSVIEGEGLVNDATALTLYRIAAAAVVTHSFSVMTATAGFALMVVGEIAWGVFIGWSTLRIRRFLNSTPIEVSISLLTPFLAYLPAEQLGGTGVLATVAAGFYVGTMNSQLVQATTRLEVIPVWTIIEFMLEGILFLVTGMQLRHILEPLGQTSLSVLLRYGALISVLVILVRIAWVFSSTYFPRMIVRKLLCKRDNTPRWSEIFVLSWSGMRGAVSLVAAFSIPLMTAFGTPFPQRDLIIFMTFCVIVTTLILQGLSLSWFIRFFKIDREGRRELAVDGHHEIEARLQATEASLGLLANRRETNTYPNPLLDRIEELYRYRRDQFHAHLRGDHDGAVQHGTHALNLQTELVEEERRIILQLRRQGAIDDRILRRMEKDLDLQEMRLRQGIAEWNISEEEEQLK